MEPTEIDATPLVRLEAVSFIGAVMGGLVAGASGCGLVGVVLLGILTANACAIGMVIKFVIEGRDRRALRPVVRDPRCSHVRPITRDSAATGRTTEGVR